MKQRVCLLSEHLIHRKNIGAIHVFYAFKNSNTSTFKRQFFLKTSPNTYEIKVKLFPRIKADGRFGTVSSLLFITLHTPVDNLKPTLLPLTMFVMYCLNQDTSLVANAVRTFAKLFVTMHERVHGILSWPRHALVVQPEQAAPIRQMHREPTPTPGCYRPFEPIFVTRSYDSRLAAAGLLIIWSADSAGCYVLRFTPLAFCPQGSRDDLSGAQIRRRLMPATDQTSGDIHSN
jgi:hypothetical protein